MRLDWPEAGEVVGRAGIYLAIVEEHEMLVLVGIFLYGDCGCGALSVHTPGADFRLVSSPD